MFSRLLGIIRSRRFRLRYQLSKRQLLPVSQAPLWMLPDGFTVTRLGETGVRVMDNFCTAAEAQRLVEVCRDRVRRSTVIAENNESVVHSYRTSSDTMLSVDETDPVLKDMVHRTAGILGLKIGCVERVSITRYGKGEYYKSHYDHDGSIKGDRLYTVLVYLNDLAPDEGGGTLFPELNLIASPVQGRAVSWINSNPDKSVRPETRHAALPVLKEGAEKWVIQFWFRGYECSKTKPLLREAEASGKPLKPADDLPAGVRVAGDIDEDSLFEVA